MRVLFWTEYFPPSIGGIQVFSARLAPELVRRGHEVVIVTELLKSLPEREVQDGVRIERLPMIESLRARDLDLVFATRHRLAEIRRRLGPDVVHLNLMTANLMFHLETERAHPAPTVAWLHCEPWGRKLAPGMEAWRAIESAGAVVGVSRATLDAIATQAPGIAVRGRVLYSGLATPRRAPSPLPFDPPRLCCVGRVVRDKGFDLAIRAMPAILSRRPETRLTIVGDGPERPVLRCLADDLGVGGAVDLGGAVAPGAVPEEMDRATIVIVPSRWAEPFGLVGIEAMMAARALIVARRGGLPEMVVDGETGVAVEPESPEAIAEAVLGLLADRARCETLARAGRAHVERHFAWPAFVDAVEVVYREVTHAHAGAAG